MALFLWIPVWIGTNFHPKKCLPIETLFCHFPLPTDKLRNGPGCCPPNENIPDRSRSYENAYSRRNARQSKKICISLRISHWLKIGALSKPKKNYAETLQKINNTDCRFDFSLLSIHTIYRTHLRWPCKIEFDFHNIFFALFLLIFSLWEKTHSWKSQTPSNQYTPYLHGCEAYKALQNHGCCRFMG